ncbi:MAG: GntR family transcriptional regulator, partial [Gammaproteobacteria bacterium]|nr:GntR family transcriptional regulator [Gammaproteobacteria bacterium]
MPDTIIYLDPSSPLNLQEQIRQKLVDGILSGALPPGHKLPSSRKLSEQLEVARNTVVLSYQQLVADGYLISRARSGIFVNEEMLETRVGYSSSTVPTSEADKAAWKKRTKRPIMSGPFVAQDLPNWTRYPYPFVDGKFDASLFPIAEWREASR